MIFSFRFLSFAASLSAALVYPTALSAGADQRKFSEPVAQSLGSKSAPPIIFFIAKGAANSCGEGCDTWIAAYGQFDSGATARLKRLLARIGKRDLPIFFFSPGGISSEAVAIGRLMRERKMRVGVARTIPADCKDEFSDSCNAVRRAGRDIPSSLNTLSMCASACVYALLGGQTREVSAMATLAVHSSKIVLMRNGRRIDVEGALVTYAAKRRRIYEAELDRYTKSMGIDLELLKVARSVPHESSRKLTREEVFKFGIDRRDSGDSGWSTQSQDGARAAYVRLFRKGWGGDGGFSEVALRLSCNPDGSVGVGYVARGGADVTWPLDDIVVGIGSETVTLRLVAGVPPGSPDIRSAVVQRPFALRFPSATSIWIARQSGGTLTNRTAIGLAGFANAMSEILPRCVSEQARPATPVHQATPINELPASMRAAMAPGQPGTLPPSFPGVTPGQPTPFNPLNDPVDSFAPFTAKRYPLSAAPFPPVTGQKSP